MQSLACTPYCACQLPVQGHDESLSVGAGFTWDGMIHKISPKQWDAMLAVHCTAPFRLIQAGGLPIMCIRAAMLATALCMLSLLP